MLNRETESIERDTRTLLLDDSNLLYTSVICVQELTHLRQIGKLFVENKKRKDYSRMADMVDMVKDLGIKIVPVNEMHLRRLDALPLLEGHRDPNDRLIIAQAIADKATLVSSDTKFLLYRSYGLSLHYNRR
ncbi:MAG: type II toxin-antitoxin system VapC family toxin [Porphyromonadaceae bacterium]|nr:type II toxin-antitoxin system VapC family toxin [Porphyromonadaceae bacterium]